jgi:hypothetical protein
MEVARSIIVRSKLNRGGPVSRQDYDGREFRLGIVQNLSSGLQVWALYLDSAAGSVRLSLSLEWSGQNTKWAPISQT